MRGWWLGCVLDLSVMCVGCMCSYLQGCIVILFLLACWLELSAERGNKCGLRQRRDRLEKQRGANVVKHETLACGNESRAP